MRKLLNTLYVTSPDKYLSLDGENIVVLADGREAGRVPLHNLEGIVTFGYSGASPALMGYCARNGISLSFHSPSGRFLAEITGGLRGNVTLRKTQYRLSDNEQESAIIGRNMIIGKVYNSRWVLERATRDHPDRVDVEALKKGLKDNIMDVISTDHAPHSEEEKKNYEVIPRKFDVEYEKIYDIIKKQEEADKKEENNKEDEVEDNKKQEENTNDDTDDKKEDNKEDNKKDNKEEDKDLIPTYYNLYDKIDIPVRNQYSFGLCWCFASLKSIETNLAITKGKYYDLSEIYIDYMLS